MYCNLCSRDLQSTDVIWHCTDTQSEAHPDGYDLCTDCILHHRVSLCIITWNVSAQNPPDSLGNLLHCHSRKGPCDLYVIGLQEMIELSALSSYFLNNEMHLKWEQLIERELNQQIHSMHYYKVQTVVLMGLVLMIYAKTTFRGKISNVLCNETKIGFLDMTGNKGAVGVSMTLFGGTRNEKSLCFVCCHLSAHRQNVKDRNEEYKKIMQRMTFSSDSGSNNGGKNEMGIIDPTAFIVERDMVYLFGDLNYRLDAELTEWEDINHLIGSRKWNELVERDQLLKARKDRKAFVGFNEYPIRFQPTYKYVSGTNQYEHSRIPSYCDRILWRVKKDDECKVECVRYYRRLEPKISDHKPVVAWFQIVIPRVQ